MPLLYVTSLCGGPELAYYSASLKQLVKHLTQQTGIVPPHVLVFVDEALDPEHFEHLGAQAVVCRVRCPRLDAAARRELLPALRSLALFDQDFVDRLPLPKLGPGGRVITYVFSNSELERIFSNV